MSEISHGNTTLALPTPPASPLSLEDCSDLSGLLEYAANNSQDYQAFDADEIKQQIRLSDLSLIDIPKMIPRDFPLLLLGHVLHLVTEHKYWMKD
ncbi:hypothetical protein SAICODRAFT_171441 [Saitoella complicata NRRL Y-17804]|nr:uncharacterized protein SAICODRAFT_171441 [Saitoella complicata NRRL Y-17804]ODQ50614.1 hypothetical protein SAICODRAFT_171441 [Saitoella complicata NRRL Y-17804]